MQETVLVVDDDEAVQALIRVLLTRKQFVVDCAGDGEQALQKIRTNRYAAILLDLMMPRLNGFEVLREIKALYPSVMRRIIVFTAASDSTLRDLDASEVFQLIRKPFDIDSLISAIVDCTRQNGSPKVEAPRTMKRSADVFVGRMGEAEP